MYGRSAGCRQVPSDCLCSGGPSVGPGFPAAEPPAAAAAARTASSRGAVEEIIAIFPSRHLPSSSSDAGPTTSERDFLGFLSLREIEVGTAHALPGIGLMTCPLARGERICSRKPEKDGGESQTWISRFQFTGKKLLCFSTNVDI